MYLIITYKLSKYSLGKSRLQKTQVNAKKLTVVLYNVNKEEQDIGHHGARNRYFF